METGMLHLHNILRWVIIILLLVTIYQAFAKKQAIKSTSLWLMITAHTMLLIGLYQLLLGRFGILNTSLPGSKLDEKFFFRFYWVEHPLLMFAAIALITVARSRAKVLNYKSAGWLLLSALIFIIVAVPWPFRGESIGRHLFPM
jgi:hypothetical protein